MGCAGSRSVRREERYPHYIPPLDRFYECNVILDPNYRPNTLCQYEEDPCARTPVRSVTSICTNQTPTISRLQCTPSNRRPRIILQGPSPDRDTDSDSMDWIPSSTPRGRKCLEQAAKSTIRVGVPRKLTLPPEEPAFPSVQEQRSVVTQRCPEALPAPRRLYGYAEEITEPGSDMSKSGVPAGTPRRIAVYIDEPLTSTPRSQEQENYVSVPKARDDHGMTAVPIVFRRDGTPISAKRSSNASRTPLLRRIFCGGGKRKRLSEPRRSPVPVPRLVVIQQHVDANEHTMQPMSMPTQPTDTLIECAEQQTVRCPQLPANSNTNYSRRGKKSNVQQSETANFEKECLRAHNNYRAVHKNCPPLTLNKELCRFAEDWAKKLASSGNMKHRSNNKYGENLYMASGMPVYGGTAVKVWYDEIRLYNYNNPGFTNGTGHFTQVVWKNTKQLGVGRASRGNAVYVVCNYDPPGNVSGQFVENVPPRK